MTKISSVGKLEAKDTPNIEDRTPVRRRRIIEVDLSSPPPAKVRKTIIEVDLACPPSAKKHDTFSRDTTPEATSGPLLPPPTPGEGLEEFFKKRRLQKQTCALRETEAIPTLSTAPSQAKGSSNNTKEVGEERTMKARSETKGKERCRGKERTNRQETTNINKKAAEDEDQKRSASTPEILPRKTEKDRRERKPEEEKKTKKDRKERKPEEEKKTGRDRKERKPEEGKKTEKYRKERKSEEEKKTEKDRKERRPETERKTEKQAEKETQDKGR